MALSARPGLQVYRLPERAGSGSFTLAVTALEEQIALLDRLDIEPASLQ
jgi:hypothetical protein